MTRAPFSIAEQAVEWFVRRDAGALTDEETAAFLAWRSVPEHDQAYVLVENAWGDADRVADNFTRRPSISSPARRRIWPAAVSMAAALLLVILAPLLWWPLQADYVTGVGEFRSVRLPDGSVMVLNTDTAASFAFEGNSRIVRLLKGEAEFQVAPDPARPFIVKAGGGSTRALGTVFTVRLLDDDVRVTGVEHSVDVQFPDAVAAGAAARASVAEHLTLRPSQQVQYGARTGLGTPQPARADSIAWLRGRLIVEDRPLAEVVKELNRYHHGHIALLDPDLQSLLVNGVIPITDRAASVDALEQSLGLKATWLTSYWVFLSK